MTTTDISGIYIKNYIQMENIQNNPRHWASKIWKKKNITEIIKEIVEPDEIDVSSIKMNDVLCKLIWDENDKLIPEVRVALLKNTQEFIKYSDVENLKFNDIILTGSLANYNYTISSDLDVHILMDFTQISDNIDLVGDFLKLKKKIWGDTLPIQVMGFDVEMYFQNVDEIHHSSGTYSILNNEWIHKPTKKLININVGNVQLKASDFINAIDDLEKIKDNEKFLNKYDTLKKKIKNYRQTGLDTCGEFSTENLVFKILRHTGYLGKMVELKNKRLTQELSLNEFENEEKY